MRRLADLGLAVALAALAVAVALLPLPPGGLRAAIAAPLVLALPGYALAAALFPTALRLSERLLLSVALALATTVLISVVLNATPFGLNVQSWAVALLLVTVIASGVASVRRARAPRFATDALPVGIVLGTRQALLLVAAIFVTGGALWLARTPVPEQPNQGYTLLWTLPDSQDGPNAVRVGVRSFEPSATAYDLRIVSGGQTVQDFSLNLQPLNTWEATITLPAGNASDLEADLYRADAPDVVYRRTLLRAATS